MRIEHPNYYGIAVIFNYHSSGSSMYKYLTFITCSMIQGRIQDFKLGGAHLKKLRRAEGGAKIFGVFHVKNHDFTPKKSYFYEF